MKQLILRNTGDATELLLYGVIGDDPFFGGGVTAKDFRSQVQAVKGKRLNLRVNSPGGSTIEASAMVQALDEYRSKKGKVEVDVDGLAASAASYLACAGDTVRMAQNALLMIHNPHGVAFGGAEDMRRTADLLDTVREQIITMYRRRTKMTRDEIAAAMDAETWYDGQQAVAAGFADSVSGPVSVAAFAGMEQVLAKLGYRHVPQILAFSHNSKVADNEPQWGGVDKSALPMLAYADHGTGEADKSTWAYPHHWVEGGGNKDDDGEYTTGTLYLHRGGLNAAWAAAMGAHTGEKASQAVIDHLQEHRRALGMDMGEGMGDAAARAETEKRRAIAAALRGTP